MHLLDISVWLGLTFKRQTRVSMSTFAQFSVPCLDFAHLFTILVPAYPLQYRLAIVQTPRFQWNSRADMIDISPTLQ
jgi:hypothetical protein